MGFHEDLALGNRHEAALLQYIEHDSFVFAPAHCKGWDLTTTYEGHTVKWEVKSDRRACFTGNVAVEIECEQQPSGLSTTDSDMYAYFIIRPASDPTLYLIPTADLRRLVRKNYPIVRGGDRCASKMVLIPITDLYEFIF